MEKKNRFLRNSGWELGQQLYISILSFIVGLFIARYLGPDNYGIIGMVTSVFTFVSALSWLGFDSILINELVIHDEEKDQIVSTVLLVKTGLTLLMLPLVYVIVDNLYDDPVMNRVYIILGAAALFQVYEVFHWWLQSQMQFGIYAMIVIVVNTLITIYQIVLIITRKDIYWFASVQLFLNLLLFGILIVYYLRKRSGDTVFSKAIFVRMFSKGYHFIISSLAVTLYMQIDKLMIGKMLSSGDAGSYSAAVNISMVWQFVPIAIINAARPMLIEYKKKDEKLFYDRFKKLIVLTSAISLVICIGITVFARYIILFLYGEAYLGAVSSLRISTWATAIAMLGVIRSIWVLAYDYNRYDKYFTSIAAVLNIALNYFMIQWMGIVGAALSTVISYFVEVFVVNYLFKDTRHYNRIMWEAVKESGEAVAFAREFFIKRKRKDS